MLHLVWPCPGVRPPAHATLVLTLTFAVGACDSSGSPSTYVVRDSAGVRIVESSAAAWEPEEAWTVSEEPVLHIGVVEGPEEYRFVAIGGRSYHGGVWQQSDGTIVAAETGTRQMRRYAPDGRFLNWWGGRGEGPGEFRSLSASPYRGDSIMARDANVRYVFYDSEGNVGRTLALDLTEMGTRNGRPFPIASTGFQLAFGDGTFLGVRFPSDPFFLRIPGQWQSGEVTFLRFTADGELADTIGVYRSPEVFTPETGSALLDLPFTQEFVFTAGATSVYVGSPDGFEVRRVPLDDSGETLIRASHVDLRTTDAHRASYRNNARALAAANPSRADLPSVERALLDVVYPETVPAFSQLMADTEGYLWVRHYKQRWSEGPETWSVFHPEGYLLGTVETPERLQVRQIGPDFIVGIWTDELEVRFVRKHALVRR